MSRQYDCREKIKEFIALNPRARRSDVQHGTGISFATVSKYYREVRREIKAEKKANFVPPPPKPVETPKEVKMVKEMVTISVQVPEERAPATKRVCDLLQENPDMTPKEIKEKLQISLARVYQIMQSDPALKIRLRAHRQTFEGYTKKSLNAFKECLELKRHPDVKLKAATRQLEEVGVIGPEALDINVNNVRDMTDEQLDEIIKRRQAVPAPVIVNGEIVP